MWAGKRAIVTGASGGIGEELAVQLAAAGAHVALVARRRDELERVASRCGAGRAQVVVADVANQADCERATREAITALGGLDVLVHNAGQAMWAPFEDMQDATVFEKMLAVNYLSVLWSTRVALAALKESRGRILAVSSIAGITGVPLRSGYVAAKHAMTGFLNTLRIELADAGVSVTIIHPGWVATGSQARNLGADGNMLGKMPVSVSGAATAADVARALLAAGARRERRVVLGWRSRIGILLKEFFPGLIDGMAAKAIRRGR